jgi:hypothetical protein
MVNGMAGRGQLCDCGAASSGVTKELFRRPSDVVVGTQ